MLLDLIATNIENGSTVGSCFSRRYEWPDPQNVHQSAPVNGKLAIQEKICYNPQVRKVKKPVTELVSHHMMGTCFCLLSNLLHSCEPHFDLK